MPNLVQSEEHLNLKNVHVTIVKFVISFKEPRQEKQDSWLKCKIPNCWVFFCEIPVLTTIVFIMQSACTF